MEIFHWDENIIFPEVIIYKLYFHCILQLMKIYYYFQALSLDKDRFLTTNKMLNVLILSASAFIVIISSIGNTIPNDAEFKKLLKNHILLILKDNDFSKSV